MKKEVLEKGNHLTLMISTLRKHLYQINKDKGFKRAFFPIDIEEGNSMWSTAPSSEMPLARCLKTYHGINLYDEFFGNMLEVEELYIMRLERKISELERELDSL